MTETGLLAMKLKACPFCGAATATSRINDDDNRVISFHIECNTCSCKMSKYLTQGSRDPIQYDLGTKLVEEWNGALRTKI